MEIIEIIDNFRIIIGAIAAILSYVGALYKFKKKTNDSMRKWLQEFRQSYPFYLGIFFTIVIVLFFIIPPLSQLEIKITSPQAGASVPLEITVEGYANKELPKNQHLYIVLEYGGRWWPQYSEVNVGYSSSTKRYEFSTPARIGKEEDIGETFVIRAILVDSTVHQHFQNWFQRGEAEGWLDISITEVNQWGEVKLYDYITVKRR